MRQPTFFAQACPRFDHQVYWPGFWLRRLKTSTKPSPSNTPVSQARSCGRKPEFFWFDLQLLRSISWCAMFQSPHRMISQPRCLSFIRCLRKTLRKRNLDFCRCGPAEPEGRYTETTHSLPKRASTRSEEHTSELSHRCIS